MTRRDAFGAAAAALALGLVGASASSDAPDAATCALPLSQLPQHEAQWLRIIVRALANGDHAAAALAYEAVSRDRGEEPDPAILEALCPGWGEMERV